ncbi:HD domain-containing protein [Coprococcus sp. OM04-5BH]|uniref:3'-5' exoribonuclease YhaM family protein n=1 Tax=Coprococcus sp. OM04-5BH TaxID=2293093 RepID=UPI000E4E211F|nr:HD domain-containing protein [Coprococcus sp. OM04-5BH]RHV33899.1 HD domain-containing protein [Coprococcus sp. OM04-5BH]
MRYIEQLQDGENVSEVYLCKNKIVGKTKSGKSYYSLLLQDKTGSIDAKIWELNNGIGHFDSMNYVRVDGQITTFNNALQLNVKKIRIADEGEYVQDDYMPCTKKDVDEMFADLLKLVDSLEHSYYKTLLKSFFVDDKETAAEFKRHSAAKTIHHGYIGGLLEHSLAVAKMCDYYTTYYKRLNRDLLITAALLHDIGKIYELSGFPENDYTDAGQLLGHIVMGTMMIRDRIKDIPDFPAKAANELEHCILAHHGELEYGSPKKPALLEALALSFADNTDAKIQTFMEALDAKDESGWLGYNKMLESNIRRTTK